MKQWGVVYPCVQINKICQLCKSDVCLENFQFKNVEDAAGRIREWIKKTPLEVRALSMKYINILLHDLMITWNCTEMVFPDFQTTLGNPTNEYLLEERLSLANWEVGVWLWNLFQPDVWHTHTSTRLFQQCLCFYLLISCQLQREGSTQHIGAVVTSKTPCSGRGRMICLQIYYYSTSWFQISVGLMFVWVHQDGNWMFLPSPT